MERNKEILEDNFPRVERDISLLIEVSWNAKQDIKYLQLNYIKVISWNFKFNGTLALFLLRN